MRLDVVDLLVAQYPGTAPTRILLVGTSSTCTTAVDLGTCSTVLLFDHLLDLFSLPPTAIHGLEFPG